MTLNETLADLDKVWTKYQNANNRDRNDQLRSLLDITIQRVLAKFNSLKAVKLEVESDRQFAEFVEHFGADVEAEIQVETGKGADWGSTNCSDFAGAPLLRTPGSHWQ